MPSVAFASLPAGTRKGFVTAITSDNYIQGVQGLARSLNATGTRYPLYVLVTRATVGDPTWELLSREPNVILKAIERLDPKTACPADYAQARFSEAWTKLRCWQLEEEGVAMCAWLDADMVVVKNIDHVLSDEFLPPDKVLAAAPACLCNPCKVTSYPAHWTPADCRFTHHNNPEGGGLRYFNTGFFVFRPSATYFQFLRDTLDAIPDLSRFKFPEQDFLNEIIPQDQWICTSYIYNALKTLPTVHPDMWKWSEVCILHYILDKPWIVAPVEENEGESATTRLERIWWMAYNGLDISDDLRD
ncbi:family 8 glycosyl transferase [Powellomyces hirtus]|nr:family 8 glycosyl transferase [Powellomyces hirtus]